MLAALRIDPEGDLPVYRQIADGVRTAALEGHLREGNRLPATRDLARQLGVNRQTVVAAYDYLASQGWARGRTGRGTFLVIPGEDRTPAGSPRDPSWLPIFSRVVEGAKVDRLRAIYRTAIQPGGISFAGSYPDRDLMPVEGFREALDRSLALRGSELLSYGPTQGDPVLRETLAGRMRREGSEVEPADLLVTHGAQQAIELIFHTFLERGDSVVVEEPTYTGALSVLGSIGARIISVPVDEQGIRADLLEIAAERHRPRLMYVQPTFQNPTTAVMGPERRRDVLAIAARSRCTVVEDDWAGGLSFSRAPEASLHSLAPDRVIHVNTFSKKLLPGIRVGWIAAAPATMKRLATLKALRDCGTSLLLQGALDEFLRADGLDLHLERVLPVYRARRDTMLDALSRFMPDGVRWTRPDGGLFCWVTLPEDVDADALFRAAGERSVLYSRGELFHANLEGRNTLRLTYSSADPSRIETGIEILAQLIRDRQPDSAERAPRTSESMPFL